MKTNPPPGALSRHLHPATRLFTWLVLLVAVQCLDGAMLLSACLAAPLALALARAARQAGRLIARARWLLASLFIVFAWGTAGEPLWRFWNESLAPTREGIGEALKHLGRLALVLASVAAFLETTPLGDLLAGARVLLAPLRRLGLDSDRGIVRLMLALRYAQTLPNPRDWRALLAPPEIPETCETIEIGQTPLRWIDACLMAALAGALGALCFR